MANPTAVATGTLMKGGEWLIKHTPAAQIFVPEEWTEEQLQIAQMCRDFIDTEVLPHVPALDDMKDPTLMPTLLKKAGAQGLLGISIPEQYGGFGLDFNTSMLASEILGAANSFSVALVAHTGIGTLPILYFGTEEQKQKYLPKLASGEWLACYCLTEPGSGSDALGAKTKATLSADGKTYTVTGQKMWITNGGFADTLTVFAQVDGDKFTGLVLEKTFPGITMNEEEKKMGIKGSSTRQIFFNDVPTPAENVLGEIGKGHRIAFNILNVGRLKLSACSIGSSKRVIDIAVQYANERQQFKRPISSFGAIQHKLAEMAIKTFACESATYRASYDVSQTEHKLLEEGKPFNEALLIAAQEFAAECAMMKVHGSEVLDYVVDEGVQIHGGYGFSAEYPMDRAYRDSRINRIYEGTNEINRMLSVDYLLKKAFKGELDLMGAAMAVQKELTAAPDFGASANGSAFAAEHKTVEQLKKAILMVAGGAAQKFMAKLEDEQEILMAIADMLIEVYVAESTLLRVEKLASQRGEAAVALQIDAMRVYLDYAVNKVADAGRLAVNAMAEGDMAMMMNTGLKRFTKTQPYNTVAARRRIAAALIEQGKYIF
ncbi:MAG: acyl-CoA dehydrogenase family protein [Bacteroidia bacterium]|nr:acyl-CoA dehydrogenase family protein [Bacteroidia bacterium]